MLNFKLETPTVEGESTWSVAELCVLRVMWYVRYEVGMWWEKDVGTRGEIGEEIGVSL